MALLGGVLAVGSCQKENNTDGIPEGAVLLTAEGFGGMEGDKTSVSAESVVWENGDRVNLDGTDYTVTVSGDKAYVTGFNIPDVQFQGIYPAGLVAGTQTVTVPSQYESHYSNGRQVLHLPMLAMAGAGANAIRFRHATAAVRVLVKNSLDVDVVVTGVRVSSAEGQLCGTRGVTLGVGTLAVAAQSGTIAEEDKQVSVELTDSPVLAHGGSDIIEVQVPILPVAEENMTITVYAHMAGAAPGARNFTFTHTASHAALGRNVMMTARVNLSTDGGHTTEDTKGRFSVGGNGWVVFAQGNLQYNAGTSTFRFAPEQYDIIGDGNSQIASNYSGWIDLMGWGTSGYGTSYPYLSTTHNLAVYGPATGDIATTHYDWGVHNAIEKAGVAGTWHTLTSSEWYYLLNTRNVTKRFAKVALTIGNNTIVNGLVLFPDSYNFADGLVCNQTDLGYEGQENSNKLSLSLWQQMEAEGAVFLPAAGYREGTQPISVGGAGFYWSSSKINDKARALRFDNGNMVLDDSPAVYYGYSIRLCSDISAAPSNN